jgi:hypothetical protein
VTGGASENLGACVFALRQATFRVDSIPGQFELEPLTRTAKTKVAPRFMDRKDASSRA